MAQRFNPAPGWPAPPSADWTPGPDWAPDPSWPPAPDGWQVLVDDEAVGTVEERRLDGAAGPPQREVAAVSPAPTYGGPAYLPPQRPAVIVVGSPKSVGLAAVLGFLFGPLGMLYSTVLGAAVMFGVNLLVGFVTLGLGLLVTWPICAVWAAVAANQHNQRMVSTGAQGF